MSSSTDKCKQLRELQDRLADELRVLKESVQEEEPGLFKSRLFVRDLRREAPQVTHKQPTFEKP